MLDGLALSILEGVVGSGEAVAHEPGIHRPTGVDVFFAEVGVAVGILFDALLGLCRSGSAGLLRLFGCFGFLARN